MALSRVYEVVKNWFDDGNGALPVDFKYIAQLRFIMNTIGSWPHKQFGRSRLDAILSTYNLLLIIWASICVISCVAYLRFHVEEISFFDMGHSLLCILLTCMYMQRLLLTRFHKYRETIRDYLTEFHLYYFKRQSKYAAKIHSQIHIISGMFTFYVMFQIFTGMILYTFVPWYDNYSRGMFQNDRPANITFEHAVYFYCFTDSVYTTTTGYWILFAFNIPITYVTAIGMAFFDLLLCLIGFQIWGHLKILNHNLLNIALPVDSINGMYSDEENVRIRKLMRENIEHHKLIVTFVDKCSDAFSEYLFVFYLLMQLITCILLLEVSSLSVDAIAKYGPMTVAMNQQLMQVSILFEMLNTKSEQLIEAVYAVPWECMNVSNRRTVQMFLHRVQTPVSLKAAKLLPVGVSTMSTVLRNTFSYYTILKAIAGDR